MCWGKSEVQGERRRVGSLRVIKMSFGRPEWPELGELVVATVKRIVRYGAYVSLDEYEHKEGLLHISEISTRWVRNIRNHVREGQKVVLQVLRVNISRGHIDLSLKRVTRDERRKKIELWKKSRKAETLIRGAAHDLGMDVEILYEKEGAKLIEFYGSLYSGLEAASEKGVEALSEAGVENKVAETLAEIAKDRIVIKKVTIHGVFELTSMSGSGVEDIRNTLLQAMEVGEEDYAEVNIYTIGVPKYRIEVTAVDYKKAEVALDKIVNYTENEWDSQDGAFAFTRE